MKGLGAIRKPCARVAFSRTLDDAKITLIADDFVFLKQQSPAMCRIEPNFVFSCSLSSTDFLVKENRNLRYPKALKNFAALDVDSAFSAGP